MSDFKHLPRLPDEYYRGDAYVHWTMTIGERKTGWLSPPLHFKLREILTHTMFRFGLCCPIYCCMPDHAHFLWLGLFEQSDQRLAVKYFRMQMNVILRKLSVEFQRQPFDHVLREKERERGAFEATAEYIARNPERKNLVPPDGYRQYRYTSCLVPGYPELDLWSGDYCERFWRVYSALRKNGLMRGFGELDW